MSEEQCDDKYLEHGCGVQPKAIRPWLSNQGHGWWVVHCQHGIKSDIPKHTRLSLWLSLVLMWCVGLKRNENIFRNDLGWLNLHLAAHWSCGDACKWDKLTRILNLYSSEGESARQPNSNLVGLYFGTYPSAPVQRKTFSMLQKKESPRFCTGSTITRP